MIDFAELEQKIKKGNIENCYALCGLDEDQIKGSIRLIVNKVVDKSFKDFNYVQFDGSTVDSEELINACETLPFMSDKKVVVVYRASFLEDGKGKKSGKSSKLSDDSDAEEDGENTNDQDGVAVKAEIVDDKSPKDKTYKAISSYVNNMPEHCILIMYYIFQSKRDKASSKIQRLGKKVCVVNGGKPRRDAIEKRAKALFEERGREIGAIELKLFCQEIENKLNVMSSEVEKLCSFTEGRKITKEDIRLMMPPETDNDIFDLVDALADKNIQRAIDILNELTFKGEKIPVILRMIERQFNLLFNIKLGVEAGKGKEALASQLGLHPFVCGKMIEQSRKFSLNKLKKAIEFCLNSEEKLKSASVNANIEMELLIINTIAN